MKSWISDYVLTARTHRKFGRKADAYRFMQRAKVLKSYLIATGKYEDKTNAAWPAVAQEKQTRRS